MLKSSKILNYLYNSLVGAQRHLSKMAASRSPIVAVCQMTSTSDKEANFYVCKHLIEKAKLRGAAMVFLPECFDYVGESKDQSLAMAETLNGDLISRYKTLAKQQQLWLSLGGFHHKGPSEDSERVKNMHIIVDSDGEIKATYTKTHLFDLDIKDKVRLKESVYTIPGQDIVPPVITPVGKLALSICYDLRFPELSIALTQQGAEILTFPSAFTQTTGMAHWQVVDPWGCVVSECHEGTDVCLAEIDLDYLTKVRTEMPVQLHRRPDLYGHIQTFHKGCIDDEENYKFGSVKIRSTEVFYKSALSIGFVNIKPVVPGHVLVASIRPAKRFADLTPPEVSDLFSCVQKISKVVEQEWGANSVTVAIQDGQEAGQTIEHVHVHILPRKPGDFAFNDNVYVELDKHDKDLQNEKSKLRTREEMKEESMRLRTLFD